MNSPIYALAWEVWTKNRRRYFWVAGVILGFAVFYPRACSWAGLGASGHDALDLIGERAVSMGLGAARVPEVVRVLAMMFLACAPMGAMILTLLYVVWNFTGNELQPKSGNAVALPARLFTLPVSTGFLWLWLTSAGAVSVTLLYLAWTRLVPMPAIEAVAEFHNCIVWVALLLATQAVLWSLNYWPVTRALLLNALLIGFLTISASSHDIPYFRAHFAGVLAVFSCVSGAVSYAGLVRIRHGRWQESWWSGRGAARRTSGALSARGGEAFASPARAQFWFEWHGGIKNLVLATTGCAWIALILVCLHVSLFGPLKHDEASAFAFGMIGLPPFVFCLYGLSPGRKSPVFQYVRPMSSGEMFMAKAKALALGAVVSLVAVLAAAVALRGLSDVPVFPWRDARIFLRFDAGSAFRRLWIERYPLLLLVAGSGMVFVTWGLAAGNLCFGAAGRAWPSKVPAVAGWVLTAAGPLAVCLAMNAPLRESLVAALPCALAALVVLKLALALWAFRMAHRKRLLASEAMIKYLAIWVSMVVVLVWPALALLRDGQAGAGMKLSVTLGIMLLLPLARIGFAPVAISMGRHETGEG